jgi:hypothetical protein
LVAVAEKITAMAIEIRMRIAENIKGSKRFLRLRLLYPPPTEYVDSESFVMT